MLMRRVRVSLRFTRLAELWDGLVGLPDKLRRCWRYFKNIR